MTKVNILTQTGEVKGEIELPETLFNSKVSEHAVYTVVKNHLANKRQGTQSAKTRAEVRGGGKKPWRQKGTGRARHGSSRSPIWRAGGVTFAPKPRSYAYPVPKKIRRLALTSVLTRKVQDDELIVVDQLTFDNYSTKAAKNVLQALSAKKKAYVVVAEADPFVLANFKNLEHVDTVVVNQMNVYDLVYHDSLIMTEEAIKVAQEVFQ